MTSLTQESRCYSAGLKMLMRREHSKLELFQKLQTKGFDVDVVNESILKLVEQNYQSDDRFSEEFIQMRFNQGKGPVKIASDSISYAKKIGKNLVIIDTAGRLAVDDQMMNEIKNIHNAVNPQETLFVVDSMTGQDAVNTAKTFNDILNFDGVILTKLDGDTRGGAALSITQIVDMILKFIGTQ